MRFLHTSQYLRSLSHERCDSASRTLPFASVNCFRPGVHENPSARIAAGKSSNAVSIGTLVSIAALSASTSSSSALPHAHKAISIALAAIGRADGKDICAERFGAMASFHLSAALQQQRAQHRPVTT